jgi:hypothetical protein
MVRPYAAWNTACGGSLRMPTRPVADARALTWHWRFCSPYAGVDRELVPDCA